MADQDVARRKINEYLVAEEESSTLTASVRSQSPKTTIFEVAATGKRLSERYGEHRSRQGAEPPPPMVTKG